ncbi:AMP-binding protein [Variovorax guangxiensis]|uniref:AMP-binding protein n=1 Tax=Variovorax guangxiensis TaxID=1775474 RepID=UPI002855CBAA|nr:AMP-binding protein [Variovorax guangxiensis]MDR6861506.1 fatty-acyl-CoA synthase [Variovorax guangxiensis]
MTILDAPPQTLPGALAQAARKRGSATFLIHGDVELSYAGLEAASARVAAGLIGLGIGRGDRVGLLLLNRPEWVVLFFACSRIGAVAVGMSPRFRGAELGYILRDSEVKAVATMDSHEGCDFPALFEQLAGDSPSLEHLISLPGSAAGRQPGRLRHATYAQLDAHPPSGGLHSIEASLGASDPAMVIYTSGTTGRPKGACLTHGSMLASAAAQAAHMRVNQDDLLPLPLPLNHVGGITCGVLTLLLGGGRIDLLPEFKAALMLERIRRHLPTLLAGVPTIMTLILMHSQDNDVDFSSVRLAFIGGSSVDPSLLEQMRQRMPGATLMNLYGLSETSGAIVLTPWDTSDEDLMGSIGAPVGDAELRVVLPGSDQDVAAGEVGEICFRGCGVVAGYVGAARAGEAFLPGGWLRTGDLGRVDARGVITLCGRAKDMYIQGGFNVYPAEVEAHIARHRDVLMVAGIGVPDPVLGEIGHYFVVRRPGAQVTEDALRGWCADELSDYKVPRRIEFRDELPLTPAGKIHKAALREAQHGAGTR